MFSTPYERVKNGRTDVIGAEDADWDISSMQYSPIHYCTQRTDIILPCETREQIYLLGRRA